MNARMGHPRLCNGLAFMSFHCFFAAAYQKRESGAVSLRNDYRAGTLELTRFRKSVADTTSRFTT